MPQQTAVRPSTPMPMHTSIRTSPSSVQQAGEHCLHPSRLGACQRRTPSGCADSAGTQRHVRSRLFRRYPSDTSWPSVLAVGMFQRDGPIINMASRDELRGLLVERCITLSATYQLQIALCRFYTGSIPALYRLYTVDQYSCVDRWLCRPVAV